jgi:hypothetical protein
VRCDSALLTSALCGPARLTDSEADRRQGLAVVMVRGSRLFGRLKVVRRDARRVLLRTLDRAAALALHSPPFGEEWLDNVMGDDVGEQAEGDHVYDACVCTGKGGEVVEGEAVVGEVNRLEDVLPRGRVTGW